MRLLDAASQGCKAAAAQPLTAPTGAVPAAPDWNPLSISLTSLATAFTWGCVVAGIIAILVAIALVYVVNQRAAQEARETAKKCANEWLDQNGPKLMRDYIELIQSPTIGGGGDGNAADQMGEGA